MNKNKFSFDKNIAWCPGCGDFAIRKALLAALADQDLDPKKLVLTSGIGQAAKLPQYIDSHYFNGLHGRGLPLAAAIKSVNPSLTVLCVGGDGDMYGEGGNHFIHNIRRNIDVTHLVHNNMVYGLTKGQASPTSQKGMVTPLQVDGVINQPFNPLSTALALGATFVARCFSSDIEKTSQIITKAMQHKGYALIDIFQPCVSFNKINTHAWYKEHSYYLEDDHDSSSLESALLASLKTDPYPLGIFYQSEAKPTFEEAHPVYEKDDRPITSRKRELSQVQALFSEG